MAMVTFTSNHNTGNKREEDGEIGVFGAEKYFNGAIGGGGGGSRSTKKYPNNLEYCTKHQGLDSEPVKPLIHRGAPTSIHSQTSWNSQNPLLRTVIQNPPLAKPSKAVNPTTKSFLSSLAGCTCYCFDRSSIDIEVGEISFKRPANGEIVQLQGDQNKTSALKEDLFSFPTMEYSTSGIRPVKVVSSLGEVDEIGRKSLEVFGSPVLGIGRRNKSLNLQRRLKMLSWDDHNSIPKVEEPEDSKGIINCNDAGSDASSDLFEIESVTGKLNHCYAPSEASIEWSVVTASAADYEEGRRSTTLPSPLKTFPTTANDMDAKKMSKPRSSGLLGCNSSKAVKIDVDAHKTNQKAAGTLDPRMRRVSDSYIPATRFQAEAKFAAGVPEPTQTPRIRTPRSLTVPHSYSPPQTSQLLFL